jgi:hypothetical protein
MIGGDDVVCVSSDGAICEGIVIGISVDDLELIAGRDPNDGTRDGFRQFNQAQHPKPFMTSAVTRNDLLILSQDLIRQGPVESAFNHRIDDREVAMFGSPSLDQDVGVDANSHFCLLRLRYSRMDSSTPSSFPASKSDWACSPISFQSWSRSAISNRMCRSGSCSSGAFEMKLTICSRRFFGTGCGRAGVMMLGVYHSRRFFPAAFPDWLNCMVSWAVNRSLLGMADAR